nr:MAG TPA: hypothetical protein [Caudoviricetes sp.]
MPVLSERIRITALYFLILLFIFSNSYLNFVLILGARGLKPLAYTIFNIISCPAGKLFVTIQDIACRIIVLVRLALFEKRLEMFRQSALVIVRAQVIPLGRLHCKLSRSVLDTSVSDVDAIRRNSALYVVAFAIRQRAKRMPIIVSDFHTLAPVKKQHSVVHGNTKIFNDVSHSHFTLSILICSAGKISRRFT